MQLIESISLKACALCASLIGPSYLHLRCQLSQSIRKADWVELRLDKLSRLDLEELRQLRQDFPIPMIFTLRKASHGGDFKGSDLERLTLLNELLSLEPEYVDIEADTPLYQIQALKNASPQTKWILSYHNFEETPANLEAIFNAMTAFSADFYKIATRARSICDAFRLLSLAKKANADKSVLCALGMGEEGLCTRVLSPIVGNPFTFAALELGQESAAGQLSVDTFLHTYHFRELNRNTIVFGLIGDPIDKSMSHLTHNAVLKKLNQNAVYIKFNVKKEDLSDFILHAPHLNIKGLSVTMPHKEAVLAFVDPIDPLLSLIGSCNTLLFKDDGIKGINTDGQGAIKTLRTTSLAGKKTCVLGAGGTAKAIAYEAKKNGAILTILNRTPSKAKAIAERLDCRWGSLEDFSTEAGHYDLVIQATSVGMAPYIDETPVEIDQLSSRAILLDVVSNPKETRFLQAARLKGCETYEGSDLFVFQAALQFSFWLGEKIDQALVEETIRQRLPVLFFKRHNGAIVRPSQLTGSLALPPSKSHSIRAVFLGAMAKGLSVIDRPLKSPDVEQAIKAARQLGAVVHERSNRLEIEGVAGQPQTPDNVIDAGNSGQTLRFFGALAALSPHYTVITGDHSIRTNRIVQPLLDGLEGLGGFAKSTRQNGRAPIIVKGPLKPGVTTLSGEDSQPVSALLMAAAFMEGTTVVNVVNPGEKPWVQLTLSWLDRLGVSYARSDFDSYRIQGKRERPAFHITIPGDFSSAAFPIVAALITGSEITLHHVDMEDSQGDKALIPLLRQMGARLEIDPLKQCLHVKKTSRLQGRTIDVNPFIDAIVILAVVGCYAEGETILTNAKIARHKESDRVASIVSELKKMGADIEATEDGLRVRSSKLKGAVVNSHDDHRLALSLLVAGLLAEGETHVEGIDCVNKSYPTFIKDMRQLGAFLSVDAD